MEEKKIGSNVNILDVLSTGSFITIEEVKKKIDFSTILHDLDNIMITEKYNKKIKKLGFCLNV